MEQILASTESHGPDRFLFGYVDGRPTLFALHWDHTICIAKASQPVTHVESAETIINELRGLAA
jgi:hypothetical protein